MKKVPFGLWLMLAASLIILTLGSALSVRVLSNHSFVKAYEKGDYSSEKEEDLLVMNFPESYVPYYNLGNIAFKNGDYITAATYYEEALKRNPAGEKDCLIRINLALSMCYAIDFEDIDTLEKKDAALKILQGAKNILLENGCAGENGDGHNKDGHNKDAQKLKEDIDNMIILLKKSDSGGSNSEDNNSDPDSSTSEQHNTEANHQKEIKEKLQENRKQSMKENMENQKMMDKWSGYDGDNTIHDENYDWEAKTW